MTGITADPPSEEEGPGTKYVFDQSFQSKIAALLMRDTVFAQRTDGLIKPDYLESDAEAKLSAVCLDYYRKYKRMPADKSVLVTVLRQAITEGRVTKTEGPDVIAAAGRLYSVDISDRDFVIDSVAKFARYQETVKAITESIRDLDMHNFDGIQKKLNKALNIGAGSEGNAYDFGEMLDARTMERKDIAAGIRPPSGVSTGYPVLDDLLYHQGWGKGELAVLMGGAKAGKTTALMQFGLNACAEGKNVLYMTLEVSAKILGARMDSNISSTDFKNLKSNIMAVHDKVKDWAKNSGKFIVEEFPTGTMTCSDLSRAIERYRARGLTFDLVIVDYADIMAPERYVDSVTENSKSVYTGLRAIAQREQCALLTATQTNRDGFKAAVAKAEHIAEDFNKVRIADVIISINASEEEIKEGTARLYFAACRNQAAGFSLKIRQNREQMKFITTIIGRE